MLHDKRVWEKKTKNLVHMHTHKHIYNKEEIPWQASRDEGKYTNFSSIASS